MTLIPKMVKPSDLKRFTNLLDDFGIPYKIEKDSETEDQFLVLTPNGETVKGEDDVYFEISFSKEKFTEAGVWMV